MKGLKNNNYLIVVKIISVVLISFFLFSCITIYADEGGNTGGGTSGGWEGCSNCEWKFDRVGVRLSLYRYDGINLSYYGYRDHCSKYFSNSCPSGNVLQNPKRAGKVAHQQFSEYKTSGLAWEQQYISSNNTDKFPTIDSWSSVESHTKTYFSLDSRNGAQILAKLKTEFSLASGLAESDLEYIYITIEPTIRMRNDTAGIYYYGTAYELVEYINGGSVPGMNETIYYKLPETMMAQNIDGTDKNGFIGKYVELISESKLVHNSADRYKLSNLSLITSTKGYGINVFFLGGYVTSCSITQESNKLDYTLNISENTNDITYGISNISDKITNTKSYRANSSDTMIYGVVKNSNGDVISTCSLPRVPYTCTINKNTGTDTYNLTTMGDLSGTYYGISNISGNTNGKIIYQALNKDTVIYGVIKNNEDDILASCSVSRTPYSCSINTTNNKTYELNLAGDLSAVNYGISNIKDTINNQKTYTAGYNDTNIYGTIKDKEGNIVTTCSIEREKETCASTCKNKEGNDLLSCAESFCTMSSHDSNEKRTCINTCGIEEPKFSSCVEDSQTGKDTECESSTSSSKTTCVAATLDNYYKMTCQETSSIKYPGNLPTILTPGMSFSYSPALTGNKTCKLEFETDKWIFDYISAYTDEERTLLLNILQKYNTDNMMSINNKTFIYDSSDATINMIINLEEEQSTTIPLFAYEVTNLLDKEMDIINGPTSNIIVYNNGKEESYSLYELIQTTSSGKTTYKLKGVCVSKDNNIYDAVDNECNEDDELVYEYITSKDIKSGEYDTKVTVTKTSSNLSVNNTCYYGIEQIENPDTRDNILLIIVLPLIVTGVMVISYRKLKFN